MSRPQQRNRWAIARLLFASHLPFLVAMWGVLVVVVAALVAGIAAFGTVTGSVWDHAVALLRWFALGYGIHLGSRLLPVHIAHGQTRRAFVVQATLFVVVAAAVLAALIVLGHALEGVLYRAMDWPQRLPSERLYSSPGQLPEAFTTFWLLLAGWTMVGAFLATAFYRPGGWGLVAIPLAVAVVQLLGIAVGFGVLPFARGLFDIADVPLPATVALGAGGFLVAAALTWALARDIPIRNGAA
jgi:hypothetical protein